jgi:hypothetical protein
MNFGLKFHDYFFQTTCSSMFELEKQAVHAIVAKMIINEELMASMDEPTECMVMHRTEPSRLQSLSLQLADKLAQLVENNERLLELRPGGKNFNLTSSDTFNNILMMNLSTKYVLSGSCRARNSRTHCSPLGLLISIKLKV